VNMETKLESLTTYLLPDTVYKSHMDLILVYTNYILTLKRQFDSMNRLKIHEAMKEFGIPNKLVKLTKLAFSTYNRVKIQSCNDYWSKARRFAI
jgi:hypothetical protein